MKKENFSLCPTKLDNQETRESTGINLWHIRLGHMSKDMLIQKAKGAVKGMNIKAKAEIIECNTCVKAKQTKPTSTGTFAKRVIDHFVRSDVTYPITHRSGTAQDIL